MESLSDFYDILGSRLLGASVLYLPNSLVDYMDQSDDFKAEFLSYCDRIIVLEKNGDNYPAGDKYIMQYVLPKRTLLDTNIINLLELKETYQTISFQYILKKYAEYVYGIKYVSKWLLNNINQYIEPLEKDHYDAMVMQHEIICAHDDELHGLFKDLPLSLRLEKKREDKQFVENALRSNGSFTKLQNMVSKPQKSNSVPKSRTEKLKELKTFTMGYADNLVLKTIFNVSTDAM